MNKNIKIGIVGVGAIGGTLACALAKNGFDIEAVCKYDETLKKSQEGFKMSGVYGNYNIAFKGVKNISDFSSKKDIILIITKAYDLEKCAKESLSFLNNGGLVVSMQNGICIDTIVGAVGIDKAVACAITYGATMHAAGDVEVTSEGGFTLGMCNNTKPRILIDLCEILNTCFPSHITQNILEELYSKLIINSCITAMGAVCGLTLGEMLKMKKARSIFIDIIREAIAVSDKMSIIVPAFGGQLDYYKFLKGNSFFANIKRNIIISVVGNKYKKLKSSSLQSLERGQQTEIDYFAGYICKKGDEFNVDTPVNDKIYKMVKEIEEKKRSIEVSNLTNF